MCLTILDSFPDSWESFCQTVNARSEPRTFSRLFDWFLEEETRVNSRKIRGPPPIQEEENLSLTAKERSRKPRDGRKKPFERKSSPRCSFQKDFKSKVMCYACNRRGHSAKECPHKSKTKYHAHAADVSESEEEDHEEPSRPKKKSKSSQREEAKREFFFVSAL